MYTMEKMSDYSLHSFHLLYVMYYILLDWLSVQKRYCCYKLTFTRSHSLFYMEWSECTRKILGNHAMVVQQQHEPVCQCLYFVPSFSSFSSAHLHTVFFLLSLSIVPVRSCSSRYPHTHVVGMESTTNS